MADLEKSTERVPGPELRLVDRRAFVGFPELKLKPGVTVTEFALQIPDITFPLNLSGGAAKYQKKKLDFGTLELSVDAEVIQREVRALAPKISELDDVKLHFRPGHLEVQAWLRGPEKTPITFKVAFDGEGERLAVYLYDVRLYGFSPTPASRVGAVVSEAIRTAGVLPEVERRGVSGFTTRILPGVVEAAAVARGYKVPALDQARLAEAVVSSKGLRLRFSSGGLPPSGVPDEELLLALEGARAFADAEELLAEGKLQEARAAYLKFGDASEAHPFAVERLLTLLVADPQTHELVLDIAESLARRRDRSATAIWAEAVVRERRGEFARASERYLALSSLSRRFQDDAGAFFAAEAAARASRDHAPQLAVKALHELLGLKPDHLPSLKALARASDQAKDRAGAIRAYRRLAALARDAADAAEAHVQLARLCAETEDDLAGARLHCEAALRLAPDHPEALLQLGQLCYRSGEWLRAIKALDRLREVAMARHEVDRIGRANLLAGLVWETGLKQPENALLRFREAASLLPGEPEPLYLAARVADALGKVQEAVAGYQQAIELAGPAPRTPEMLKAAHASHHALSRLLKSRLGEPTRAREHLEAAVLLDPQDTAALDELLPFYRASGKAEELALACEKAAAVIDDVPRRAALWAEAGELYRGRLNQPDKAERLLSQALEADARCRPALEGLLALAESRRDGAQLCRCLKALAGLAEDVKERVRLYRRLAVAARDLSFDLELAALAYREVLKVEPDDLPMLGELTALERRRADLPGLCWALEQRARVAEQLQDKRLAAAALRELSQVLDTRLGRAGEALVALEKATRLFPEPNTLLELATLSLRVERPLNARRALEDVLAMLPPHAPPEKVAEVRARLGRACELLGDKDAARENYAVAFPLRRLDDELALRLEILYADAHRPQELIELWASRAQALLQAGRSQDAAPLFFKSALAAIEAKDTAGALLRLNAALDASPTGAHAGDALEAMARLELDRGEPLEAARLYARRAALATGRGAARWFHAAAALSKDTPREPGLLAKALEHDEGYLPARLRRGELNEASNPREALADFEVVLLTEWRDDEAVTPFTVDLAALNKRAASAAQRCGQYDAARRFLSKYTATRPDDLDAQLELAALLRRAGAMEPLVDLLGELWPQLAQEARLAARREYTEGALALGRSAAAVEALRSMLADAPLDEWASSRLLALLPVDDAHLTERLELVSRLVATAQGETKAELLAHRAELYRSLGDSPAARADLLEAAECSARPLPLLRALAEYAREAQDEAGELRAWRLALAKAGHDALVLQEGAQRLFSLAQSRLSAGDAPGALEAYEGLATLELQAIERQEAWLGVARAARALGDLRRTEQALLEASRAGVVSRRVEALCERAVLLEARGARGDAVDAYGAALALAPRDSGAFAGLTGALRALEDWEGLAEVLAAEVAQAPRRDAGPLLEELAALYLDRLGETGPGEAALRALAALDAANVPARRRLAALLVAKGELLDAVPLLEAAAEHLAPTEAAGVLREAAALARRAQDETLELKLLRAAHRLVLAAGKDLERLAEALYLRGAVREALPLQVALAAAARFDDTPEEAEQLYLRLADLALETGDRPLAEATLTRLVAERPLSTPAVERLAALKGEVDPRAAIELLARHFESLGRSARAVERLVALARDSQRRPEELELTARLYRLAAAASDAPLPIHQELVGVLRDAGRTAELMGELHQVAQLCVAQGQVADALAAWDEESRLAEAAGRVDDALRTVVVMAELAEEEGRSPEAAALLVRQAHLLRDAKLDLPGAAHALEHAWELAPLAQTAEEGVTLARRRSDREGEIDWTERRLGLLEGAARAESFVVLARLHLGLPAEGPGDAAELAQAPMLAPDQAEAALRQALELSSAESRAQAMLLALFERQDRVGDIALWLEEAAQRATEPKARAELLLRAARLYQERAGRPHEAAAALLAARAADPDDLGLTAQVADLLTELGRRQDASDFDAILLERDPFHPSFQRHVAWLEELGEPLALAALYSQRAQAQLGAEAASTWLAAADAFLQAGAFERAQVCDAQAFEASAGNLEAFQRLTERAKDDPRRLAELLALRAGAVPGEASTLLRQRAQLVSARGDPLLAAAAWDDYLSLVADDLLALAERADLAARGGGARAAQPFDRRLVQLGGDEVPLATRLASWTRLGHAAMESRAWHDAVDAFETVLSLDPDGPRGREVLALLSEAYAHLDDAQGQYRTTLKAAQRAEGAEADALYRRALSFPTEPEQAWDALAWLLAQHPGEDGLYEKGLLALARQGRHGEAVALHQRYAAATGGPRASAALLAAARLAQEELHDELRAYELLLEAAQVETAGLEAATAALAEARRRGDLAQVEALLRSLAARAEELPASGFTLELAAALEARGQADEAKAALEPLRRRGPSGAGYTQALTALERLARAADDIEALVALQRELAELEPPEGQARRLLDIARTWQRAGRLEPALEAAHQSLAAHPSRDGLNLVVDLARALGQHAAVAQALERLADAAQGPERAAALFSAVDAWDAAGQPPRALAALERAVVEASGHRTPDELATRFLELGAPRRAFEVGFTSALDGGRAQRALELADAAGDAAGSARALQVLAFANPGSPEGTRYARLLRGAGDVEALVELAAEAARSTPSVAVELWRDLALLDGRGDAAEALAAAHELTSLAGSDAPAVLAVLLAHLDALPLDARPAVLTRAAKRLPSHRKAALRALATVEATLGHPAAAVASLSELLQLEERPAARAALRVEQGSLQLRALDNPTAARSAFELALVDDAEQLAAVQELVQLYSAGPADRFVAMVERLGELAGDEAVAGLRESLADAYEGLGRVDDAYQLLAQLEPSPPLLRRRARLAELLGRRAEALELKEQAAGTRAELEAVLEGYLEAQLVPFAARLGERLLADGPLEPKAMRLLAERLAPTTQGAQLAVRAFEALLADEPVDADGWTLYAEALRRAGWEDGAQLADGFGAALTSTRGPAPAVPLVALAGVEPSSAALPPDCVVLTDAVMPRLNASMNEILEGLGVTSVQVLLNPAGGVEAFLSERRLVLGVGALAVFGPPELAFLTALALRLGPAGAELQRPGPVPGFDTAAVEAFGAAPASLAACRVVAHLSDEARGVDPRAVDVGQRLRASSAFRALTRAALARLKGR